MRHILKTVVVLGLLSLSACGDAGTGAAPGATTAPAPTQKSLFNNWVMKGAQQTAAMVLGGLRFGGQAYMFYLSDGGACACTVNIAGTQSSGTIVLASCSYVGPGTGGADPGCADMNGTRTYTKTADTLTVCNGESCADYK